MQTLILVYMEWPPRLHVLYIATAAAPFFAYDPFSVLRHVRTPWGKIDVSREGGTIRCRWFGFVLTRGVEKEYLHLGLAPEQSGGFAAIPSQYLL